MCDIPDSTELGRALSYSSCLNEAGASQGSTGSGTVWRAQFPCCLSLLSLLCFHCCRKGSVIKSPFLLLPLCLPASTLDRPLSSRLPAYRGGWWCWCWWWWGGGLHCGTQAIVLREVTGRSDPKSMRKQLCCSKLYFCRAGSCERSRDIRRRRSLTRQGRKRRSASC